MKLPWIRVASYEEAQFYLTEDEDLFNVVVSINDRKRTPPPAFETFNGRKLALSFDDVVAREHGSPPELSDASALLEFVQALRDDDRVLFHCLGGISRSTASAIAVPASRMTVTMDNAHSIMRWIAEIRPVARPNPLFVKMIDELLSWNNRLVKACLDRFGAKDPPWGWGPAT